MSYQLRVQETPGYVHILVTGANTPEVVRGYLREVLEICARGRRTGVLIEENLTGRGMNLAQIYNIVSEGSERRLAHLLKIAFVNDNTAHPVASVKFAETVARNRGINVRAFSEVVQAGAWLCEEKD